MCDGLAQVITITFRNPIDLHVLSPTRLEATAAQAYQGPLRSTGNFIDGKLQCCEFKNVFCNNPI